MKTLLKLCLLFLCLQSVAQTGNDVVKKMHERYFGKWYKTMTFSQVTEIYRNDSVISKETWYEAGKFPYDFRINVGDPAKGNGTIYTRDSTYYFKEGKMKRQDAGTNPFTFLMAGMYCVPLDSTLKRIAKEGFDLTKSHETNWKGKKTIAIGAEAGDTTAKQFWIDAKELYIVRVIEPWGKAVMDAHFTDHKKHKKGWTETNVWIYINNKLRQKEIYSNIKTDVKLQDGLFDPKQFGEIFTSKN